VDGIVPVAHGHHRIYHRLRGATAMTDMGDIANMRAAAKAWRANAVASGETVRAHDKIDELIDEIEHLRRRLYEVDAQLTAEDHIHARENMTLRAEKDAEINTLAEGRALEPKP
jgi:hypothetical protein